MPEQTRRRTPANRLFRAIFGVAVAAGSVAYTPPRIYGQAAEPKTAEQAYKNITQLKGVPADQLTPAMQFISASLGVDCALGHARQAGRAIRN